MMKQKYMDGKSGKMTMVRNSTDLRQFFIAAGLSKEMTVMEPL
jgi:hypothetical protein